MFVAWLLVAMSTSAMAFETFEVPKELARHLNCLKRYSKSAGWRSLDAVMEKSVDKSVSSGDLREVFSALLKCLSDPTDRCRETALMAITEIIRCVPQPEERLPYLMPCLAQRFGGKEILEPAEEIRLSAVEMLTVTLEVCGKHSAPYLNDVMNILQKTIVDPFPDVKRESCKCAVTLAKTLPGW